MRQGGIGSPSVSAMLIHAYQCFPAADMIRTSSFLSAVSVQQFEIPFKSEQSLWHYKPQPSADVIPR